jgi:uncharacterized membrane protein
LRVICSAKSSTEPPRFSATTTATSFADFVTSALMASSTAMVLPGRSPSFEGACAAAFADTLSGVSSSSLPRSSCSKTR